MGDPVEHEQQVAAIRRFNRLVTERIGALNEDYLARTRPLGSSRVLWEIEAEGTEVRQLRSRLSLDSGYLSRLLRGLEADGLVEVSPSERDTRVRRIELTEAGWAERTVLDNESDRLATSLLAPLTADQRGRLVEATETVERLMTAGLVQLDVVDPGGPEARFCLGRYFAELDERFDTGFDPEASISAEVDELTPPAGVLLVGRLRDEPIGCGALKLHGEDPAEIKRMWVGPGARGLGLGRRLLVALEAEAAQRGATVVRLETNGALTEAIGLYRSAGYREVPAFNDEPFAHHWFEKRLDG